MGYYLVKTFIGVELSVDSVEADTTEFEWEEYLYHFTNDNTTKNGRKIDYHITNSGIILGFLLNEVDIDNFHCHFKVSKSEMEEIFCDVASFLESNHIHGVTPHLIIVPFYG